jgi:cytochrome c oxidase subunit II
MSTHGGARDDRRGRAGRVLAMTAAAAVLSGCAQGREQQSILNPRGSAAESIHGLGELMLLIGVIVWFVVAGATVAALFRRRRADPEGDGRRATWFVAIAGAIIPAVVIVAVTVQSTLVLDEIDPGRAGDDTVIQVTGHQYWWEVRYPDQDVVTANEVHIPVGEKVRLQITSDDVIHSFWVPELSGKTDMIPGRSNTMWLETDQPGTYWGQCAEFCGQQHALMRLVVVAHEPEEFEGWVAAQQEPAPITPAGEESTQVARGREVFMSSSCVYCHAVEGTAAAGELGPDLTHLASRESLAAGILPNDRGNLAAWIVDPQSIKPGNLMPGTDIEGEELQDLLAYLESLE